MTRKMLKEATHVDDHIKRLCAIADCDPKHLRKDIRILVAAVRLDERMENQCDCDECRKERRKWWK